MTEAAQSGNDQGPAEDDNRPHRYRSTARVLLIDDRDRMLLFNDGYPGTGQRWWITAGGGIDPGETPRQAALRELIEETGLVLPDDRLIGPIGFRTGIHHFRDDTVENADTFFVAVVPAFTIDISGHTADERETMTGSRWWSRDELAATTEMVLPTALGALWDHLRTANPGATPLDLGREDNYLFDER